MFKYSMDSFCKDCKELAERVREYNFTHILYIERGGRYIAQELIKYYPKALTVPIKISFYNGQEKRHTPLIQYDACVVFKPHNRVLVVDDLCDTGDTMNFLKESYLLNKAESVKTAVLIKKPTSTFNPDYYVLDNVNDWCVFPWEDEQGNHIF